MPHLALYIDYEPPTTRGVSGSQPQEAPSVDIAAAPNNDKFQQFVPPRAKLYAPDICKRRRRSHCIYISNCNACALAINYMSILGRGAAASRSVWLRPIRVKGTTTRLARAAVQFGQIDWSGGDRARMDLLFVYEINGLDRFRNTPFCGPNRGERSQTQI